MLHSEQGKREFQFPNTPVSQQRVTFSQFFVSVIINMELVTFMGLAVTFLEGTASLGDLMRPK